jgi:hypothetical protein
MPMNPKDHTFEVLNGLVFGEVAALEACNEALQRFPQSRGCQEWSQLHENHLESVDRLRELILREGGRSFCRASSFRGAAGAPELTFTEETAVVQRMMHREQSGLRGYAEALADQKIPLQVKKVIREELLPPLQYHLIVLLELVPGMAECESARWDVLRSCS